MNASAGCRHTALFFAFTARHYLSHEILIWDIPMTAFWPAARVPTFAFLALISPLLSGLFSILGSATPKVVDEVSKLAGIVWQAMANSHETGELIAMTCCTFCRGLFRLDEACLQTALR
jgi:hypothetical protein